MRKVILSVFFLVLSFGSQSQSTPAELTFIYWMPYDNNLSNWADSIYSMILSNLSTNKVVVTIQKDVANNKGMTRSILTMDGIINEHIDSESSSGGTEFNNYLEWVAKKVPSNKYCIIFLDHGGKLDELGLDEYPVPGFLRVDSANRAIENFNKLVGKKTELIFLQVCTKGSIEPLYELKDASRFTMFSQTLLGAPNYYYAAFFNMLSITDSKNFNGLNLATLIAEYERPDMYESLVCIDNSKFNEFNNAFKRFLSNYRQITDYQISNNQILIYYGQTYFDFASFIQSFRGIQTRDLIESLNNMIVMNKINPATGTMVGYSGVSLLAFQKNYLDQIRKYEHLRFFQTFEMEKFYLHTLQLMNKK